MIRWVLVGTLLFGTAVGACALEGAFHDHVRFGFNQMRTLSGERGNTPSFNFELPFHTTSSSQTSLELGCAGMYNVGSVSAMINTRFASPKPSGFLKPYCGIGLGVEYAGGIVYGGYNGEMGPAESDPLGQSFVWQTMVGLNIDRNLFVEIKYINGGRDYNTGLSFGVGTRF